MKPSYYRISLDIHDATSQLSFSIKKGDTKRRLIVSLTDDGVPYTITNNCYAVFSARKPDGTIIFNDCTIKNNQIIYDITQQTTSLEGRLDCEITLYGINSDQITSPRFTIIVYASVYTENEVESSDEYKSLMKLVSEGNALIKEVERKLANGEFVGESGKNVLTIEATGSVVSGLGLLFEFNQELDVGSIYRFKLTVPEGVDLSGVSSVHINNKSGNKIVVFDGSWGTFAWGTISLKYFENFLTSTLSGRTYEIVAIKEEGTNADYMAIINTTNRYLGDESSNVIKGEGEPTANDTDSVLYQDMLTGTVYKWVITDGVGAWVQLSSGETSTDVQINGVSITKDGVANIPYASGDKAGLFKSNASSGIFIDANSGHGSITKAPNATIDGKSNNHMPIVPSNLDYAVKVGITTNTETLTDEEKAAALAWLGMILDSGSSTKANDIVKRFSGGNIFVPSTPSYNGAATSKYYVDNLPDYIPAEQKAKWKNWIESMGISSGGSGGGTKRYIHTVTFTHPVNADEFTACFLDTSNTPYANEFEIRNKQFLYGTFPEHPDSSNPDTTLIMPLTCCQGCDGGLLVAGAGVMGSLYEVFAIVRNFVDTVSDY